MLEFKTNLTSNFAQHLLYGIYIYSISLTKIVDDQIYKDYRFTIYLTTSRKRVELKWL